MSTPYITADWAGKDAESLLWLASYPRSGNTFSRILLANYFASDENPYDINQLHDFIPPDTSGILWDAFARHNPIEPGPNGMWRSRRRFIEHYRRTEKPSPFGALKTHTANVEALGTKAFDILKNDRIVYVVRHPLDVILSFADFNGHDLESAIQVMCESGGCVTHEDLGLVELRGSWLEHVSTWLNTQNCPVLLVRYEELCVNTEEILKSMLAFLGVPVLPERVKRAVAMSKFDRVRAQEAARRFDEASETSKSGVFFRKGLSFQWLRELSPEQAYRLADACEPLMSKLGYTHPRDVFFDGRNALQPMQLRA